MDVQILVRQSVRAVADRTALFSRERRARPAEAGHRGVCGAKAPCHLGSQPDIRTVAGKGGALPVPTPNPTAPIAGAGPTRRRRAVALGPQPVARVARIGGA